MIAEIARQNMVASQLRTNRVTDERLLEAFATVPRERFVPTGRRAVAYVDEDIEIARGRFLMEPRVLGRLLQSLAPAPNSIALVVGSGTGYSTAILAKLVETVVAVESDADLSRHANAVLSDLGIDNVAVFNMPHVGGYPAQAPYDIILIDGGVHQVPHALVDQLAEGGRLAAVRRSGPAGQALLVVKSGGVASERVEFDAIVPVLPGFEKPAVFVF
jgi:protein-L-isoaspartate(D-aspartate) O-methyltransferase